MPDPYAVGQVGDSLVFQGGKGVAALTAAYQSIGFQDVTVDGLVGRFVWNGSPAPSTQQVLDGWAADSFDPAHLVVALGTNDATSSKSIYWSAAVTSLLAHLPVDFSGGHHVWWVNLAGDDLVGADGLIGSKGNTAKSYNDFLDSALAGTGVNVLDWNAYVKKRGASSWWLHDTAHVHMTDDGYAAKNAWLADQIACAP